MAPKRPVALVAHRIESDTEPLAVLLGEGYLGYAVPTCLLDGPATGAADAGES